jgi:NTE family protein
MIANGFPSPRMATPSPTVSLALGSGGARGLAHIGVIQWLNENGYTIRSIAGTSMGALVGGIYAAGKLEVYTEWVTALERMHVLRLLDPTIGRPGIFKGERIISVLRELIGECDIEALPVAFTAVATDLDSGQEVWLRQGKLFDAIRASIATPMVFTPVRHGQRVLIDGAVVNPVPVAPTQGDGTDLTIAVNLDGPSEARPAPATRPAQVGKSSHRRRILKFVNAVRPVRVQNPGPRGPLDVAFTAMQTMQDTIAALKLSAHPPDVTIEIPRNACGFFEFWRAEELIAFGRARAAAALAQATDSARASRVAAD